jgi:hypothetical protein
MGHDFAKDKYCWVDLWKGASIPCHALVAVADGCCWKNSVKNAENWNKMQIAIFMIRFGWSTYW